MYGTGILLVVVLLVCTNCSLAIVLYDYLLSHSQYADS